MSLCSFQSLVMDFVGIHKYCYLTIVFVFVLGPNIIRQRVADGRKTKRIIFIVPGI